MPQNFFLGDMQCKEISYKFVREGRQRFKEFKKFQEGGFRDNPPIFVPTKLYIQLLNPLSTMLLF